MKNTINAIIKSYAIICLVWYAFIGIAMLLLGGPREFIEFFESLFNKIRGAFNEGFNEAYTRMTRVRNKYTA